MSRVGIRELKNGLSRYLRRVQAGETITVTDRGRPVAELRPPGTTAAEAPYRALAEHARRGRARLGAANRPDLYPELPPVLPEGAAQRLLDVERADR